MESRIHFSPLLLIQHEAFSYSSFSAFRSSCEMLSDYGWFRIENEKLQTEKFNPSRRLGLGGG